MRVGRAFFLMLFVAIGCGDDSAESDSGTDGGDAAMIDAGGDVGIDGDSVDAMVDAGSDASPDAGGYDDPTSASGTRLRRAVSRLGRVLHDRGPVGLRARSLLWVHRSP